MLNWLKDPTPAGLFIYLTLLSLVAGIVIALIPPRGADASVPSEGTAFQPQSIIDDPQAVDELPVTEFKPESKREKNNNIENIRLIGRMAEGVRKVAKHKGGGVWWECGKTYTVQDDIDAAIEWASRIVYLAREYSDTGTTGGITINPWGVAGTAANECGFDRCALGKWPRKWGYDHGTIDRRKRCISHPFDQIKATLLHPDAQSRWGTIGIDAAPLHVLWRCSKGKCRPKWNREGLPAISLDEVFSLGKGFEYNVREMKKRAIDHKTDRPWLYWRGYRSEGYDAKVKRWARMMGAQKDEI